MQQGAHQIPHTLLLALIPPPVPTPSVVEKSRPLATEPQQNIYSPIHPQQVLAPHPL